MSEPRYIRIGQLASTPKRSGRLPFSPNSIWRLSRQGKFPKPVRLSEAVTAWRLEDIEAWEKSLPTAATSEQVQRMAKSRCKGAA